MSFSPISLPPVPSMGVARGSIGTETEAARVAREFEAVFLAQSFDQAFKTLPASSFGGGQAAETWRQFLARSIADEVALGGRTGIAESLIPLIEGQRG